MPIGGDSDARQGGARNAPARGYRCSGKHARRAVPVRLLRGGDDGDADGRLHVGMQPEWHVDHAQLFQWFLEVEATPVDLDAELAVDRFGDVGGRDRTE